MLSPAKLAEREGKLTASAVGVLMGDDLEAINNLWLGMVGDPAYVEPSLDWTWPVQHGIATEALNLRWYEHRFGCVLTQKGTTVVHPATRWAAATLDGFHTEVPRPVECKAVGGFEKLTTIIDRYQPQMQWQMFVTGTHECALSVIEGGREPVIEIVRADENYSFELLRRAQQFMECVWNLTPPVMLPPVAPPARPEKTYDMTGNNSFASNAVTWVTTRQAARDNEAAAKAIKEMVPADAVKCDGHGITVSRNKAGSLSIRERG